MKHISRLIVLLLLTSPFISCDDYEDFEEDRDTVVGFSRVLGSSNVNLDPGDSRDKTAVVFVSDVSNSERSFGIEIDTEENEITTDNFTFDSQVIIPANERTAEITITVTNNSLPIESQRIAIKIVNSPNYVTGGNAGLNSRTR
ncbi:hypothetical protein P700755_001024 [Psychroflexus torquis ATCC 700755]|uniref:DUF4843 domain-containing protein n=1 Tax=Psychroflexus torquis (strain ATCC 700755 / CIP 106069 / ACAM 623) TaxID=313595 RepID=K4IG20_PSYTT|nr:hypothetical protein [Psychroflexus torquis]AFU67996.1 hypothetical protein P700755_001024 [Psychroflexus torquis ATCC 700755]